MGEGQGGGEESRNSRPLAPLPRRGEGRRFRVCSRGAASHRFHRRGSAGTTPEIGCTRHSPTERSRINIMAKSVSAEVITRTERYRQAVHFYDRWKRRFLLVGAFYDA